MFIVIIRTFHWYISQRGFERQFTWGNFFALRGLESLNPLGGFGIPSEKFLELDIYLEKDIQCRLQ